MLPREVIAVIDRIEGRTAVLRTEEGDELLIPCVLLGDSAAREGTAISLLLTERPDLTESLREDVLALQRDLLNRSKA